MDLHDPLNPFMIVIAMKIALAVSSTVPAHLMLPLVAIRVASEAWRSLPLSTVWA